jgi:hypothetical protein
MKWIITIASILALVTLVSTALDYVNINRWSLYSSALILSIDIGYIFFLKGFGKNGDN